MADNGLLALMDDLRVQVGAALAATLGGEVGHLTLVHHPANPAADWCSGDGGRCGMGWVRLVRVFQSSTSFPSPDAKPIACAAVLAATLEVGAYRCMHTGDSDGEPPSVADQTNDALRLADDASALACAVLNTDAVTLRPYVLGGYQPLASGDCGGGSLQVTVQLVRPGRGRPRR